MVYNGCMLTVNIAQHPFQSFNVIVNGNQRLDFTLKYISNLAIWIANLTTNDSSINGIRLVQADNIYKQYVNSINCGLQIASRETTDPARLDDFSSGRFDFNVLNQQEARQALNV